MSFEPLIIRRHGGCSVTIDKQYRIRLSASALRELAVTSFTPVVISVDVENRRLGFVKQDLAKLPNASVVRPDKRGYLGVAAGKIVLDKLALTREMLPITFEHVGRVDEGSVFWHSFQIVKPAE